MCILKKYIFSKNYIVAFWCIHIIYSLFQMSSISQNCYRIDNCDLVGGVLYHVENFSNTCVAVYCNLKVTDTECLSAACEFFFS